jgi:uncharacterized repeat protein (TIGR03803 family)
LASAEISATLFTLVPSGQRRSRPRLLLFTTNNESILHSFAGSPSDGAYSYATLLRDAQGNLYGTNYQGGTTGNGTVFKISSTGKESVLYSFKGTPDGQLSLRRPGRKEGLLLRPESLHFTIVAIYLPPFCRYRDTPNTPFGFSHHFW